MGLKIFSLTVVFICLVLTWNLYNKDVQFSKEMLEDEFDKTNSIITNKLNLFLPEQIKFVSKEERDSLVLGLAYKRYESLEKDTDKLTNAIKFMNKATGNRTDGWIFDMVGKNKNGYLDVIDTLGTCSINEDNEYNYSLSFLRGVSYHRLFQYTRDNDYYDKALEQYKSALKYHPNDEYTQINIELLIKHDDGHGKGNKPDDKETNQLPILTSPAGTKGNF